MTREEVIDAVAKRNSLSGADLSDANLRGAYLRGANLGGAYLVGANLSGANLSGADLRGADLRGAYLGGANLSDANLSDANLNWTSHNLISEILRQAAGNDLDKLQFAGLILLQRDWCWGDFLNLNHPMQTWALDTLAPFVKGGDNTPSCLAERAA